MQHINNSFWVNAKILNDGPYARTLHIGDFDRHIWFDGIWKCGNWHTGFWLNGTWEVGNVFLIYKWRSSAVSPKTNFKPKLTLSLNYAVYK